MEDTAISTALDAVQYLLSSTVPEASVKGLHPFQPHINLHLLTPGPNRHVETLSRNEVRTRDGSAISRLLSAGLLRFSDSILSRKLVFFGPSPLFFLPLSLGVDFSTSRTAGLQRLSRFE